MDLEQTLTATYPCVSGRIVIYNLKAPLSSSVRTGWGFFLNLTFQSLNMGIHDRGMSRRSSWKDHVPLFLFTTPYSLLLDPFQWLNIGFRCAFGIGRLHWPPSTVNPPRTAATSNDNGFERNSFSPHSRLIACAINSIISILNIDP